MFSIKNIKIIFLVFVGLILIVLVGGKLFLEDNYYLSLRYLKLNADFLKTKTFLELGNAGQLALASIKNSFINAQEKPAIAGEEEGIALSVPVLLYHGVLNDSQKSDAFNISKTNFNEQMFALKKAGWQAISLDDFDKFIKGQKQLPVKSFLLTFDDGRSDSFYPVDPILRALGYRATIFVIAGQTQDIPSKNYLSWPELKYMAKSGRWEIQSHGQDDHGLISINLKGDKGYFLTNKMWLGGEKRLETLDEFKQRITGDLAGAKNTLDQELSQSTISFAFPMGDYGLKSKNIAQAQDTVLPIVKGIYPMSFYQTWYGNGFSSSYSNALEGHEQSLFRRIEVDPSWSGNDLLFFMEQGLDKALPFNDSFQTKNDWPYAWGEADWQEGFLQVKANASTSGATTFLNGSYLWENYGFQAIVSPKQGKFFSLLARYQGNESYLSCNFSPNQITLQERVNGQEKLLAKWNSPLADFFQYNQNVSVSMEIVGQKVNCSINGRAMPFFAASQALSHGGIGFKVWDEELGRGKVNVQSVNVIKK